MCLQANQMLLTLRIKVDQGLPCKHYHISISGRLSGKATLVTLGGSQTLFVK